MKRNSLTTALLAGLAGAAGLATTASAVNLNPDGLGQVLIYPYYTVDGGNQTLVSVVNTTNRVKAVKVRVLEQLNSKEVIDFNLYLSPFDVWVGAIFDDGAAGTGPGALVTSDTSCTVPRITGVVPFRNYQYSGSNRDHPSALAPIQSSLERSRAGHIEMIEMGLLRTGTASTQLAEEATHVNGVPLNCNALVAAWTPPAGGWLQSPGFGTTNIDLPAGGLFGAGALVDVANGTLLAYNAEAIEGFYSNSTAPGALHAAPGTVDPDLRDADNGGGTVTTYVFAQNGAAVIAESFPVGLTVPNPVSLVFMHDAIYNEYNTETALSAASEWVVTFPTKRYYVDFAAGSAIPPFTDIYRDDGSACEILTLSFWDREERVPGTAPGIVDFSPPPPEPEIVLPALCYEANVLTFNQSQVGGGTGASSILGAGQINGSGPFAFNLNTTTISGSVFQNGWLKMEFDNPLTGGEENVLTTPDLSQYFGLPAIGFWAANYVNAGAQPGLLANYSGAFRHRASRANSG
jgi:hypothetical protein